jgi:uncharacterized RDD family membrane protein YckC
VDRRQDPRSIVTPYAFSVHPDLLGMPLATPWQRLGAILVDLVVIALLTRIGFLTLAVGLILLLMGLLVRKPSRDVMGKVFRVAVGCLGVMVIMVTVLVFLLVRYGESDQIRQGMETVLEEAMKSAVPPEVRTPDSSGGLADTAAALPAEPGDTAATPRGEPADTATSGRAGHPPGGLGDQQVEAESLPGALETVQTADPWPDMDQAALDSIRRLNAAMESLRGERDESRTSLRRAREELARAEERGPLQWLWDLVEDLGLGFGWGALYLTIAHAWWKGTSVGKRLFRIRVVMIDKRPLGLWLSFERAGGYAAGFATGLLGFAQILWDPNRQAIHDKISETVVIQDGKEPVPGPWMREGKAGRARGGPPAPDVR